MELADIVKKAVERCPTVETSELSTEDYEFLARVLIQDEPDNNPHEYVPINEHAPSQKDNAEAHARYKLREYNQAPGKYDRESKELLGHEVAQLLVTADSPRAHRMLPHLFDALYALAVEREINSFEAEIETTQRKSNAKINIKPIAARYAKNLPEVTNYVLDRVLNNH